MERGGERRVREGGGSITLPTLPPLGGRITENWGGGGGRWWTTWCLAGGGLRDKRLESPSVPFCGR